MYVRYNKDVPVVSLLSEFLYGIFIIKSYEHILTSFLLNFNMVSFNLYHMAFNSSLVSQCGGGSFGLN